MNSKKCKAFKKSAGFALVGAMLLMLLLTALSIGMVYMVMSEKRISGSDAQNGVAYYAAEAGIEKMTADLSALYTQRQAPSVAEIQALGAVKPNLPGITYPTYTFIVPNTAGIPNSTIRNISTGPNEGLVAQIVPMTITVEANQVGSNANVRITRSVEVALIPVFQFGVFSESDLSFFAGPPFDFAGRAHTNGNLFLASSDMASGLKFHSKITVVKQVVRQELANTIGTTATGRTAPVKVPTAPNGCDGAMPACRDLQETEGSVVGGATSAINVNWTNVSLNIYNGLIRNGATGAKALILPFVGPGVGAVQIIRKAAAGEDPTSLLGQSRLYNQASIRVLLTDSPADLPGGAADPGNYRLANVASPGTDYTLGVPVAGALNTFFAEGKNPQPAGEANWVIPAGAPASWPLIDGYLRVDIKKADGTYQAVTKEWLELGFARGLNIPDAEAVVPNNVHPNAILIFQMQADRDANGLLTGAGETATITGAAQRNSWYPINMYDTREGEVRDVTSVDPSCAVGGIMNLVELDVGNLKRWLDSAIGVNGGLPDYLQFNGYILYFSDRRGMGIPTGGTETVGEYGNEDNINAGTAAGTPDNVLNSEEDVNENGVLDKYGPANIGTGFGIANNNAQLRLNCLTIGRKNRVTAARHALRIENGSLGKVPTKPAAAGAGGGFTVASENPVYVKGNYNANNAGYGNPHAAAAVIADAVTIMSRGWTDLNSLKFPTTVASRVATTSYYRLAIAAGKNRTFVRPAWSTIEDLGTDGGVHNFLKYLETWGGQTSHYQGSLVSLYYAQYGNGIYKCCTTVYSPPTRDYAFDLDFLDPSKLPPGTPRFRDVDSIGSFQDFTPR